MSPPPPWECRYKATWKRTFKLPWREAGPPNHLNDEIDLDQQVVSKELSLNPPLLVNFLSFVNLTQT